MEKKKVCKRSVSLVVPVAVILSGIYLLRKNKPNSKPETKKFKQNIGLRILKTRWGRKFIWKLLKRRWGRRFIFNMAWKNLRGKFRGLFRK